MPINQEAFLALKMGFAAALSFTRFVIIAIVTFISAKLLSYEIGWLRGSTRRPDNAKRQFGSV